jgi:hypothetical protein
MAAWRHLHLSGRAAAAAFRLLRDAGVRGRARSAEAYYRRYLDIARKHRAGFILDTPTWRANPDWGTKLGYTSEALHAANVAGVDLLSGLRERYQSRAADRHQRRDRATRRWLQGGRHGG